MQYQTDNVQNPHGKLNYTVPDQSCSFPWSPAISNLD